MNVNVNIDLSRAEVSGLMRSLLRSLEATPEKEKALHEKLYSRLSRISAEMTPLSDVPAKESTTRKRCPCEFPEIKPCHSNCSCRTPLLSGGCSYCATYGSREQQLAMAKFLVKALDNLT